MRVDETKKDEARNGECSNLPERERGRGRERVAREPKGKTRKTNPLLALLSSLESVFSLLEWPTDQNAGIGRRRLYLSSGSILLPLSLSLSVPLFFSLRVLPLSLSLSLRCESETRCVFKCDCSSNKEKGAATIFRTSLVITWWWSLSGQFLKPNAISLRFVNETKIFLWLKLYLSDTLPKETLPEWYFTKTFRLRSEYLKQDVTQKSVTETLNHESFHPQHIPNDSFSD